MTAAEARELANENQLSIEQRRLMTNVMFAIEEEAKQGNFGIEAKWQSDEPFEPIKKRLEKMGYTVIYNTKYSEAENMDIWQISWE